VLGVICAVGAAAGALHLAPRLLEHLASGSGAAGPVLGHAQALARAVLPINDGHAILLAYLAYALACLWAHRTAVLRSSGSRAGYGELLDAGLIAALALFSLSDLNPQYFTLYFGLAFLRITRSREAAAAIAVQLAGFFLVLAFASGGSTSVGLFTPLSPRALSLLPDLVTSLPAGLENPGPGSIGRTLFLLGSLWMLYEILRSRRVGREPARTSWALGLSFVLWPLGLALLFWMPFRGVFERPGPWRPSAVTLSGPMPLDGAQISTWGGIPAAIELKADVERMEAGEPPGNVYKVINDEIASDVPFDLVISIGAMSANESGITRIPLDSTEFKPDRKYRLAWTGVNASSIPPLMGRPIFEIDGGRVLEKIGEDFHLKNFEETRAGPVFFGLAALLLLLGAALLLIGRFSRS
jgi:hypothetical protein